MGKGKPVTFRKSTKKVEKTQVFTLARIKNSGNLSTNATLAAAREFCKENSRFSVEPGLKEYLKNLSDCFKSLFLLTPMVNPDFSQFFVMMSSSSSLQ